MKKSAIWAQIHWMTSIWANSNQSRVNWSSLSMIKRRSWRHPYIRSLKTVMRIRLQAKRWSRHKWNKYKMKTSCIWKSKKKTLTTSKKTSKNTKTSRGNLMQSIKRFTERKSCRFSNTLSKTTLTVSNTIMHLRPKYKISLVFKLRLNCLQMVKNCL